MLATNMLKCVSIVQALKDEGGENYLDVRKTRKTI